MTRQPQRLVAGTTEIVFEWAGDRWRHTVRPVAGGGRTIAMSLEGVGPGGAEGDPRWPVSPVIVEVMTGPVAAAAPTLLGVGAAGRSHFSLAVTAHPVVGDTVLVEVACRVHEPPGPLGSTYRLGHGASAAVVMVAPEPDAAPGGLPRTIRWSYALGPAGITPGTGTTLQPTTAG